MKHLIIITNNYKPEEKYQFFNDLFENISEDFSVYHCAENDSCAAFIKDTLPRGAFMLHPMFNKDYLYTMLYMVKMNVDCECIAISKDGKSYAEVSNICNMLDIPFKLCESGNSKNIRKNTKTSRVGTSDSVDDVIRYIFGHDNISESLSNDDMERMCNALYNRGLLR